MNPYARHLGNRDPLKVVATTARHLEQISAALGPARIEESPAPGKWSPHEILCHLADCELVFSYRLRQTLAQDDLPEDDDLAVQIEVNAIIEEYGADGEPFDYNRFADDTEREIVRHLTEQHLDPPDVDFWRAVVAELRRRADDAAAAAA